jgi:hypothetical protein
MAFTVVPDKSTGDQFTEAMWDTYIRDNINKGVLRPIAETTLGGSAASISFTSIATDWTTLFIMLYARGDSATPTQSAWVRMNNDSAANYGQVRAGVYASGAWASSETNTTQIFAGLFPANTAGANLFGSMILAFPDYLNASTFKNCVAYDACKFGTATQNVIPEFNYGLWRSTSAVNRIDLLPGSGNFVSGTRATLYGVS